MRKVTTETQTGSKNSQRVHVTLTILVETISYDPTVCTLHFKGTSLLHRLAHVNTLNFQVKTYKKTSTFDSAPITRLTSRSIGSLR